MPKIQPGSLNFGYNAFTCLCLALNISPEDVSIGGKLAIAFGTRGSGNALAHYEPEREVINLTKMRGAGSLAHEWGHAMDDIIGKALGYSGMMSMNLGGNNIPPAFSNLIDALKFKKDETGNRVRTDFYQNSISFDKGHSKTDHGYWQSTVEMFASSFTELTSGPINYDVELRDNKGQLEFSQS